MDRNNIVLIIKDELMCVCEARGGGGVRTGDGPSPDVVAADETSVAAVQFVCLEVG
jgi:hypothetical protein